MKKHKLKNQTTEQLTTAMNMLKGITGALIIMIIILLSISIYGLIMKENNTIFIALIAVGTSCSAILTVQFILMNKIKTELQSRSWKLIFLCEHEYIKTNIIDGIIIESRLNWMKKAYGQSISPPHQWTPNSERLSPACRQAGTTTRNDLRDKELGTKPHSA